MAKKSKYIAKAEFVHGVTGKRYKPGDEVKIPDQYIDEYIGMGIIVEEVRLETTRKPKHKTATKDYTKKYKK